MWGTYWVWDARLTSVLVLFLMYLGVIALWRTVDDPSRAGRAAAILTLVGAINLPIIKFSVDWWNTLHQPASVIRARRPGDPSGDPDAAAGDGARVPAAVPHAASRRDAQRDPAPARAHDAADAGARRAGSLTMDLGPHASFIVAAYAMAALVVAGLIAWVLADYRAQRRALADLEARGVTRRSERPERRERRPRQRPKAPRRRAVRAAAARDLPRARGAVLLPARRGRSLAHALGADRPPGARHRAAAAGGPQRATARRCRASRRPTSRAR